MRIYDKDGQPHDKEPIDAQECISRLGWTTEPVVAADEVTEPEKTDKKKAVKTEA